MIRIGFLLLSFQLLFGNSEDSDFDYFDLDSLLNIEINTAAKYNQTGQDAAASITIITCDDIKRMQHSTMDEIFLSISSFYKNYDHIYASIGLNGLSIPSQYNNRFLLLLDGHKLNENYYGGAAIGTDFPINVNNIERIEVVKGPGSALYGTNAMQGVINIITKTPKFLDGFSSTVKMGSYGKSEGTFIFGKQYNPKFGINISGIYGTVQGQDHYYKEYDDPETNNGISEKTDNDQYFGILLNSNIYNSIFTAYFYNRNKGIPTGAWETSFNNSGNKQIDNRFFSELKYAKNIGIDKNLLTRIYYDYYLFDGEYPYEDNYNYYDKNISHWYGFESIFNWDITLKNHMTLGIEFQNHPTVEYLAWDDDVTYYDKNIPFSLLSVYFQNEYSFNEKLKTLGGIRIDKFSDSESTLSPRLAFVYHPNKLNTLKFLYSYAYRKPDIYEKYYESDDVSKGNPDIKMEQLKSFEILYELRLTANSISSVSVFRNTYFDLIEEDFDYSDSLSFFSNAGYDVKITGITFEYQLNFSGNYRANFNLTYQDANIGLVNSPNMISKLGLSGRFFQKLQISSESIYESKRKTVYDTMTNPILLTNVILRVNNLFTHFSLSCRINNIFNSDYYYPGGWELVQDSIKQNKINYLLNMEISL